MSRFRLGAANHPKSISRNRYKTEDNERTFRLRQSPEQSLSHQKYLASLTTSRKDNLLVTSQQLKDRLFHKNYNNFRQVFDSERNQQSLPFIISLRDSKEQRHGFTSEATQPEPFEVADKPTHNQLIKKDISSIDGKKERVFQASYRWQKLKGISTRVSCEFESSLRESSEALKGSEQNFKNIVKPARYKDIESKKYNVRELLCQRQKRLFELEQN